MTTTTLLIFMGALGFVTLAMLFAIIFIRFLGVRNAEYALNELENRQGFTQVVVVLLMAITCGVYLWQGSIASDTEERELRAYLHVEPTRSDFYTTKGGNGLSVIQLRALNDGQTPAHDVKFSYAFVIARQPPSLDKIMLQPKDQKGSGEYIPAHLFGAATAGITSISQDRLDALKNGREGFYLLGEVEYRDIFNIIRHFRYGFSFPENFLQTPSGNQGDAKEETERFDYIPDENYEY